MDKSRIEAYDDAIIAIIVTLMVLNIQPPVGVNTFVGLKPIAMSVIVYLLSFGLLVMYWNNLHNVFQNVQTVSGVVLWTNHFMLLVLSFIPFGTKWLAEHFFSRDPQLLYGLIIFLGDLAYYFIIKSLIKSEAKHSKSIVKHLRSQKMQWTIAVNIIALILGFIWPPLVLIANILVLIWWLIPDRQLERSARRAKKS